jgi:hypothetical protein
MAFYKNNIKTIQIEHSTICNAACPQCLRESKGGDYSFFEQTYIPTEFYETRIPQHVYDTAEIIDFCGALGDPCAAPNFVEVCRIIKRKNPKLQIAVATNGGMKTPKFWKELGSVLNGTDYVIFGIDGLEATNWIYRVNVKWDSVIQNARAFIEAGGRAEWQYISFAHNEHQIEKARELATSMGFARFFVLPNNRFITQEVTGTVCYGADGNILMPPVSEKTQHPLLKKGIPTDRKVWAAQLEKSCTDCGAQKHSEAYINVHTHLLPCCFIAGATTTLDPNEGEYNGYWDLWHSTGGDRLKLSENDWDDVLSSEFYKGIQESWNKKFGDGRLMVCSLICSKTEPTINFFKNTGVQE